jgi:hypothetical protein
LAKRDATSHEIETQLADTYLETAVLGRELATEAMRLALQQARAGELRDPAKTAMNAIITSGTALDKRLVLQNRPHIITEHRDPKATAAALARRLGVSIDSTAEDITSSTTEIALLAESAGANAHARASLDAAD